MGLNITREEILTVYEAGPEAVITLINRIQTENRKIIEQQATRISELEEKVKSLEVTLNKNSHNSSKPPSTDNFAREKPNPKSSRIKSGKKPGGQPGHVGRTLTLVDNPDKTTVHKVIRCKNCGKNIENEIAIDHDRRQPTFFNHLIDLLECILNIFIAKNRLWDKIHLTLQSMNESNHHCKISESFNIPFIFRC